MFPTTSDPAAVHVTPSSAEVSTLKRVSEVINA